MATSLRLLRPSTWFAAVAACLTLAACTGGGGGPSQAGSGFSNLSLQNATWGRLVDVFDIDGVLVEADVVVREGLVSDELDYVLSLNPVTQREVLTIQAPYLDGAGRVTPRFEDLFESARTGLASLGTKGWQANGTYTRVARNGAIKLEFSEFLDPATVNRLTVQVVINGRVADVRYIVKETENSAGKPVGVVVIDPTITPQDSEELSLNENGVGFEASNNSVDPNAAIRIPTVEEPLYGQTQILTNRAGNRSLAVTNSDPTELSGGLSEVVLRVFRTGNSGDPANGFSKDDQRPQLQADLVSDLLSASDLGSLAELTYRVRAVRCRPITPKVGDVLTVDDAIVLVSEVVDDSDRDAIVVRGPVLDGVLEFGDFSALPLDSVLTTFYSTEDAEYQLCWVRFNPEPTELPAVGVDPYATVSVRFSEPIDPSTVLSLESFVLHSYDDDASFADGDLNAGFQPDEESVSDFIDRLLGYTVEDDPLTPTVENGSGRIMLGPVSITADSRTYSLAPSAGITDSFQEGIGDLNIAVALRDRTDGILDLAGNPLGFGDFVAGSDGQLERISVVNPPTDRYFALRFNSIDENGDAFPEYIGQYDQQDGRFDAREIIRFSRQADPSANALIGQRAAFLQAGVATPLNPAGAVLQTLYGYHHLGFGLRAPGEFNLDVEGLSWAPFGGTVLDDVYDRYSVALSHCNRLADDYIDPQTGYPVWEKSGLRNSGEFDLNIFGFNQGDADEKIVYDGAYFLNGADTYIADSGVVYAPWPEFDDTYTWRDNSFREDLTIGPKNSQVGTPPQVTGQDPIYKAGEGPSIAAPLLTRFRCYPRGDFVGFNGFQVQIMCPSSNLPAFRVFSYGGNGGDLVIPDVPTSGTQPTGGIATGGGNQRGFGPELYWASFDFVVKVSRTFTHIFSLGGTFDGVGTQVIEPSAQPEGTELIVEWRGYETVNLALCDVDDRTPLRDANQFDEFGNFIGATISLDRLVEPPVGPGPGSAGNDFCATVSDPSLWTTDVDSLAAETKWKYFQLRITFVSNTEKDLRPSLDAYGFSWTTQ